ncbi:cupin domain-containing protein [Piscinibacter sakaiensis]|uniref:Bll7938 protein n=1 Tax=Piscinibacter sakaiensis TaxID=1547922 RepID=A0A0K8NXQ5_PISS1|nr:cupin domain-containing protein [Piscinibacter sakaiensis]GAP35151.1 Bll7938 protein [Piscinibacter sakaiensis]
MRWTPLRAGTAGAVLALAAVGGWQAAVAVGNGWQASAATVDKPLQPFSVDPSWVRSGTPNFRAVETARSPDGRSITGLWACDGPTTFEWRFGLDETVHLLEGRVEVEYLGRRFVIEPGHTAVFHAGTTAVWHVPSHAKKVFKLHHPGRLVLWWRKLFAAESTPAPATT